MARPPHERRATGLLHLVEQNLAGLHVGDDGATRMVLEHITREQHEDLVAPENLALVIDHADTIRVTVEGDAQIGLVLPYGSDDLFKVLGDGGVRVMRREIPVDFIIQNDVLGIVCGRGRNPTLS